MARRRFLQRGFAAPLVDAIAAMADGGPILDAGCGEGHHLEAFRRRLGGEAHGVDISTPAIDLAARSWRDCTFVVANADRFLPYAAASFSAVSSITARLNATEFRRVLRPGGQLIVAVAAPDDLVELRQAIFGEGTMVDRTASAVAALERQFTLVRRETIRTVADLDREAIADVMTSSYRAMRTRERERLAGLPPMKVTLSRDVMSFRA